MKEAMENIAALYGYCLRKVQHIWSELKEDYTPNDVQAGTATVFLQAVKYMPVEYLQGDSSAAGADDRAKVDAIVDLYQQALQLSLERWKKVGMYNMDAVQAGAATILIQTMKLNPLFQEDEVFVADAQPGNVKVQ
ncbi:MAG: hypothetical protein KatS3mg023_3644 [Armatimonadota bacterium]|nr:MAG: hypothetical protein KatS3mg023_3644 [Armatimonadota bacterium]